MLACNLRKLRLFLIINLVGCSSGCHLLRLEEPPPGSNSRPSISRGNVATLKRLKRLIATEADEKAFLEFLLTFRVSRSGHFGRSCGRGRPPPLCSPFLRNGARGSPNHICGSGTDLPPVTPEMTQTMPSSLCFHVFVSQLINGPRKVKFRVKKGRKAGPRTETLGSEKVKLDLTLLTKYIVDSPKN